MSARLLFNLFLLAIAGYFVWSAAGYDAPAARIPILIGGLVLVAQAWVTLREFRSDGMPRGEATAALELEACAEERPRPADEGRRVAAIAGWMLFFFALFTVLGTLAAVFLFILLFLLTAKDVRWWLAGTIAIAVTGAIRLLFVDIMKFALYPGLLFGGTLPPV